MIPPQWWIVVYSARRVDSWPPWALSAEEKPA